MSREPKPLELFKKPRHPRYNWTSFNARKHQEAVNRAIAEDQYRRSQPRGLTSLKLYKKHNKVRFGSLPKWMRPVAEAEFQRLLNEYIQREGHSPTPVKLGSLIGNATFIARHVRCTDLFRRRNVRAYQRRKLLDSIDREHAREGTPASASPTSTPKPRSSQRGLEGI